MARVCSLAMGMELQGGITMPCSELSGGRHAGAGEPLTETFPPEQLDMENRPKACG